MRVHNTQLKRPRSAQEAGVSFPGKLRTDVDDVKYGRRLSGSFHKYANVFCLY
jgi:hypothetical protein